MRAKVLLGNYIVIGKAINDPMAQDLYLVTKDRPYRWFGEDADGRKKAVRMPQRDAELMAKYFNTNRQMRYRAEPV